MPAMAKKPFQIAPQPVRYSKETHRPLNQLMLIGPLLVAFQALMAGLKTDLLVPQYLRTALLQVGVTGPYLAMGLVIVVLLAQHVVRHDPWRISGWAVTGMIVESAIWSAPLLMISWLTGGRGGQTAAALNPAAMRTVLEAIGAGVYEEFLFRLVLISLLMLILVDLFHGRKDRMAVLSVLISGAVFAAFHFRPEQWWNGEPIAWGRAAFLALAGVWWGVLYLWRGYGIAAGSHIWWDLFVVSLIR